ncbi:MAG TPA: glycosyltransferase [Thermoanaerobaculia bacterium]
MRVLIAGLGFDEIGGVQTYERDLASWLLAHGHSPVVYAAHAGDAAREFLNRTIPLVDDLNRVAGPVDVIHGDGSLATMTALLHFPRTPALYVCHGFGSASTIAPRFPRILRYIAVDDTCADRLISVEAIPPGKVSVVLNGVDLGVFRQRSPLPSKPARAVVFGNIAHELTFLPVIREACRRESIELDVIGSWAGNAVAHPESVLGNYDVAFARAKCAMEAMACGLAVILCGATGVGGMVRSAEFDRLRRLNFGARTLQMPLSSDIIQAELARYDAEDARQVSERIRGSASSDALYESLLAAYQTVIDEYQSSAAVDGWPDESRAAAAYLREIARVERQRELDTWLLAKASHRVLRVPIVGPAARRAIGWMMRRRR